MHFGLLSIPKNSNITAKTTAKTSEIPFFFFDKNAVFRKSAQFVVSQTVCNVIWTPFDSFHHGLRCSIEANPSWEEAQKGYNR